MIPAHIAHWALSKGKRSEEVAHASVVQSGKKIKQRKKAERVLQMGGGGKSPPPAPPDPLKEAQARDWEAQQAAERARVQREADAAAQALKDQQALVDWQGRVTNTRAGVENYGRQQLQNYGLDTNDPYGIWRSFTNQLDQNRNSLANNQDFSTLISNSVFDNILNDTRSATRNKLARELDSTLGADYLDTTFANTIDDSILDAILGDQYTGAQTSLKNAMDRGQMSQSAYDRALSQLGTKKTAARGELETMGRNAISGLRNEVQTAYDSTKGRANNFDFTDMFDVGSEANKIRDKATDALGRLDTSVRQAVGDKQFFDPNSIIQGAIAAGGANNYNPAGGTQVGTGQQNPLGAIFADQARNKTTEGMF